MSRKKITIEPEDVLEWLLDNGLVEPTESASHPYRIAISEDDFIPYSMTFLTNKLSDRFSKRKIRSSHSKSWSRELRKCFDEFQIKYDDRGIRGNYHWEFKETVKRYLERKLCIDLDAMHEHDRLMRASGKGGMRYMSQFSKLKKVYGEEVALKLFKKYFDRRMQDLDKDCRKGKPRRADISS